MSFFNDQPITALVNIQAASPWGAKWAPETQASPRNTKYEGSALGSTLLPPPEAPFMMIVSTCLGPDPLMLARHILLLSYLGYPEEKLHEHIHLPSTRGGRRVYPCRTRGLSLILGPPSSPLLQPNDLLTASQREGRLQIAHDLSKYRARGAALQGADHIAPHNRTTAN